MLLFLSDGRVYLMGGAILTGSPCIVFDFRVVRGGYQWGGMAGEPVGVTVEVRKGVSSSI